MNKRIGFAAIAMGLATLPLFSQASGDNPRLKKALERFPEADANKDGRLSEDEARQYATKFRGKAKAPHTQSALPAADLRDVKYGPHQRNVLDFWFAKNTKAAAPLIVFIHGGGFVGGDKSKASPAALREALDGGAAFMSINYRFRAQAPIQDILRDAARAIQFVRADAARFHIDPKRIASFGGSAGAGTSLWLAAHDDLADPKSADPVLRQSSRISAAGSLSGQATYDIREWERVIFPFKPEWLKSEDERPRFYHFKSDADYDTEQGKGIRADCNMLGLLTSDDPPIYLSCSQPDGEPTSRGHLLHHPRHCQVIERRCKELGIPVTAVYAGDHNRPAKTEGAVAFLLRHVGLPVAGANAAATTSISAVDTQVVVETENPKWTISKHLVGQHIVYTYAPDKVYADGKFAEWTKAAGISTARYPGGTIVKYWDWKNPTGVMTGDPWNPKWAGSQNRPPEEWMSLDEYLDFVKKSGITPLLGVNSLSGYQYKKTEQSVQRAVDMVNYVKAKGYGGAFWYIGNEEESQYSGGVAGYAKIFKLHAQAMKKADPNIKILWNANHVNDEKIKTFLENDGGTSDGLETHGKWPYGGDPKRQNPGTLDQWLKEVPLRDLKNDSRAWRHAANTYRNAAALKGRKNYLIANNEYGIGKDQNIKGFDRYTYGLLMTDMLQEHFLGNWDMTCFWDNFRGEENGLISPQNDYRLNPFHMGMDLLADAQGGTMLDVKTDNEFVYGFAASKDQRILLYLINKTKEAQDLGMKITGGHFKCVSGKVMRDTPDNWGELVDLAVDSEKTFEATLPALSFCQIVFQSNSNKPMNDTSQ